MSTMSPNLKRLGHAIDARVAALWKHYNDAAEAIGISGETLAKARTGKKVGRKTLLRIESAIGWEEGSVDAVLEGGQPRMKEQEIARLPNRPERPEIEQGEPQIILRGEPHLEPEEQLTAWRMDDGRLHTVYITPTGDPYTGAVSGDLSIEDLVKRVRMVADLFGM